MHTLQFLRPVGALILVVPVLLALGACERHEDAGGSVARAAGPTFALAIHGGAGTIRQRDMTPEQEARYRAVLEQALRAGHRILAEGGTSLDAVVAAVTVLEDSPLFNAGKGAVFTHEGTVELDAAIMDGATRNAGAVAGVKHIRNPILLARRVMEASPHVLMIGEGAEAFAREQGFEMVPNEYFYTDRRRAQLEQIRAREDDLGRAVPAGETLSPGADKFGTVGAVALDQAGNLAAATSTGGMANKRFGRVGDVPVIGAGTYADNATCAVSATGHGEYFIRGVVAHDIAAMMAYGGATLETAARTVIMEKLTAMGGTGGVIALDRQGNLAMPFNTEGMYRGHIDAAGNVTIGIYGTD
ncbi:MAG: isoaspartyl peptidase/L-asparaginase [Rhodothermaceae bacterium]|nr:MAG: isoaspartyl peptidase/L-asparaginase [Rhodothermaceae bacterium]